MITIRGILTLIIATIFLVIMSCSVSAYPVEVTDYALVDFGDFFYYNITGVTISPDHDKNISVNGWNLTDTDNITYDANSEKIGNMSLNCSFGTYANFNLSNGYNNVTVNFSIFDDLTSNAYVVFALYDENYGKIAYAGMYNSSSKYSFMAYDPLHVISKWNYTGVRSLGWHNFSISLETFTSNIAFYLDFINIYNTTGNFSNVSNVRIFCDNVYTHFDNILVESLQPKVIVSEYNPPAYNGGSQFDPAIIDNRTEFQKICSGKSFFDILQNPHFADFDEWINRSVNCLFHFLFNLV